MGKSIKILALCLFFLSFSAPTLAAKSEIGLVDGLEQPYSAPLIMGISSWINSDPIKLSDLKGKVILIEFWTSTCPYCKEAVPYVNDWYDRFHTQGLIIIGIHSPKTEEEHSLETVKAAVKRFDIHYPVALDNNFETWDNFNVELWPAFFLIDKNGMVVYTNSGADNFEIIDNNIQYLLSKS